MKFPTHPTARDPIVAPGSLFANLPRVEGRILSGREVSELADSLGRAVAEGVSFLERTTGGGQAAVRFSNCRGAIDSVVDGTIPNSLAWAQLVDKLREGVWGVYFAINRAEYRLECESTRPLSREERAALRSELGKSMVGALQEGLELLNLIDRKLVQDPARRSLLVNLENSLGSCIEKYRD